MSGRCDSQPSGRRRGAAGHAPQGLRHFLFTPQNKSPSSLSRNHMRDGGGRQGQQFRPGGLRAETSEHLAAVGSGELDCVRKQGGAATVGLGCTGFCFQLFSIIVFGSLSSQGWRFSPAAGAEVCIINQTNSICQYATVVAVIAFIAALSNTATQ